jgi:hypothetical protein
MQEAPSKISRVRFLWKKPAWKHIKKILAIWMRYVPNGAYFEYEIEDEVEEGVIQKDFVRIIDDDINRNLQKKLDHLEPSGAVRNAIILGTYDLEEKVSENSTNQVSLIPKDLIEKEIHEILILSDLEDWRKYFNDKNRNLS